MPDMIGWREPGTNEQLPRLAALLASGGAIGLPTETEYAVVVSARHEEAVARLAALRPEPFALVARGASDAYRWLGNPSTLGRRLARRCWPGPVDLVFDAPASGPLRELPASVQQASCPEKRIAFTCPGHEAIHVLLDQLAGPLLLGTIKTGQPVDTAGELAAAAGDLLAAIIDDGQTRYGHATTVVRIDGEKWQIQRAGIVPPGLVEQLACCLILFVCTGNTCRSPLAEALCKKLLADRLGCTPDSLPAQGYLIESAGISAQSGAPAAAEAVLTAQEWGADLSQHRSQPITPRLILDADHVITMTQGHLRVITDYFQELDASPRLLSAEGEDLPDPIGSGLPVYQECARMIRANLEKLLSEIQRS
ncbi:MAG: Sua5/YciO/YrdC/YwlC family protein [Gemmataceae bacterium]